MLFKYSDYKYIPLESLLPHLQNPKQTSEVNID